MVTLAPFVVNGRQLSISIHARSRGDRRYAEGFAEEAVKVVAEAVTPDTGRGLVIIGRKGEPHPITVFRKFLALAHAGRLDPAVAARAPELDAALNHWRDSVHHDGGDEPDEDAVAFDKIVLALPLPLDGLGAQLYQLAWAEGFDERKVDARLRALRPTDLDGRLFTNYDWVFYLPPKKAFDAVLDGIVADALKEDDVGFFGRMVVKGVMLTVKPRIRRAIEALRQGLLFETVVEARTKLGRDGAKELTDAYVDVLMPDEDKQAGGGSEHERAVRAVRDRLRELPAEQPTAPATPARSM